MDVFDSKKRSDVMSKIRSKNTRPELVLRTALHRLGYRFKLHVSELPGKPDIVLPKWGCVIQVRGCFWHKHNCSDGHIPKTRKDYWIAKIEGNKVRDRRNDAKLRRMGWTVIIVWECKCRTAKVLQGQIQRIASILERQRDSTSIRSVR